MDAAIRKRKKNSKPIQQQPLIANQNQLLLKIPSQYFVKILIFISIILGLLIVRFSMNNDLLDNAYVPFKNEFPIYDVFANQSWSSLLSGHYFGLKAAKPNSTIVSLMWFRNQVENNNLPIRHWCSHDNNVDKFFWNFNDLNSGHQSIFDNKLLINTSFIKVEQDIKARVNIFDTSNRDLYTSLILYAAAESPEDDLKLMNIANQEFVIKVDSKTSGNYILKFRITKGKTIVTNFLNANSTLDKLKETVLQNIYVHKLKSKSIFVISNEDDDSSKYSSQFIAYQIVFNKSLEIEIDLLFSGQSAPSDFDYDKQLKLRQDKFIQIFEDKFPLKKFNFSNDKIIFAQNMLSNMIGGISYFYGSSKVKSKHSAIPQPYGPMQLLTAVPSRPFFPRGFLWDEGFHQLLIGSWDPKLSMTIIKSWLGLMNKDGWIPREVVLGDEAESRVPAEFLVQHTTNANPPTLFLAIESLIDNNDADPAWLNDIYPRLQTWFNWFNTTQHGKFPTTFRWQGRNGTTNLELNPKTLTSGLDDFPRATHPTEEEIHIDLRCWMSLASRVMAKVSNKIGLDDTKYREFYDILKDNKLMEQWHWSKEHKMFLDKGLHSDNVILVKKDIHSSIVRQTLTSPKYQFVPEFGYISLFPFIINLIEPTNDKLGKILEDIENPELLWSPCGLRSIAKTSFYYGKYNTEHDGPYWRGPIWININFLVLKSLNYYAKTEGPYQNKSLEIYNKLRHNLIENMFREYVRTGYIWEQYDDKSCTGRGTHPFNGWSALIVKIMSERY